MGNSRTFTVQRQEAFDLDAWIAYYRLSRLILEESYPYRDMVSEAQFRRDPRPLFMMNAGLQCLVLRREGRMVALSHYRVDRAHSVCTAEVKFLRQDFDSVSAEEMVKALLAVLQEHGLTTLQMIVENPHILKHYQDTGRFQKVGQVRESVLDLERLDRPQMVAWQSVNVGFTLRPLHWTDAQDLSLLVHIYNETQADIPFQGAVGMVRARDADYFLDWQARMKDNDLALLPFGLFFQNQLAGLAMFEVRALDPRTASIIYTGVARAFRKRGLGRHLKACSTLHLMGLYPSLRHMVTANEETNQPMLSINQAMGFKVKAEFTMLRLNEDHP